MATFDTMATIAENTGFKRRVGYCMKKAAIAVMSELATTDNHAERVVYAKTIIDGSASIDEYAKAVVTNATLTTSGDIAKASLALFGISDSDLEFTVNSMFNAMAGVATK